MATSSAVLIAAAERLPELQARIGFDGVLLPFPDTDALRALEAILEHRAGLVVLDHHFATTSRGAALISRIRTELGRTTEIRVIADEQDDRALASEPSSAEASRGRAMPGRPLPADYRGTRTAARFVMRNGVRVQLDGDPATLIDLSQSGAQVVLGTVLRPAQRVRLSMSLEQKIYRFVASVVWAVFEPPRGKTPSRYRVGLKFNDSDPETLDQLCAELAAKSG